MCYFYMFLTVCILALWSECKIIVALAIVKVATPGLNGTFTLQFMTYSRGFQLVVPGLLVVLEGSACGLADYTDCAFSNEGK